MWGWGGGTENQPSYGSGVTRSMGGGGGLGACHRFHRGEEKSRGGEGVGTDLF